MGVHLICSGCRACTSAVSGLIEAYVKDVKIVTNVTDVTNFGGKVTLLHNPATGANTGENRRD